MTIPAFGIQETNHFPDEVHELMPGAAQVRNDYLYDSGNPGLGIDIKKEIATKFPLADNHRNADWTTVRRLDGSVVKP